MGEAWKPALLTFVLFTAGCASVESGPRDDVAPSGDEPAAEASPDILLAERHWSLGGGEEFDVLCAMGGSFELGRVEGALIDAAVTTLVFTVSGGDANSGIQLGHSIDDGEPTWLEVARMQDFRAEVPVGPDQHETTEPRWHFFFRQSVTGTPQECYTGVSLEHSLTVMAVHG